MLTVEALDTLVHTVIVTLWTAAFAAFIVGVVCLYRRESRRLAEAADTRHRPAHARPSRLRAFANSVLDTVGELADAWALLKGNPLW